MEAEGGAPSVVELLPVAARRFEQAIGADDVGFDERARPVDRPVDMALRGQMEDGVDRMLLHDGEHAAAVADVGLNERIARRAIDLRKRGEVGGVGELVDVDHRVLGVGDEMTTDGRADEAGAAGDQDSHGRVSPTRNGVSISPSGGNAASRSDSVGTAAAVRPIDPDRGVVPADAPLMRGRIGVVHLILHDRVRFEGQEAVREAGGHQNLIALFGRKRDRDPFAVGRRAAADVHGDVEGRAGDRHDELRLREGRRLEMEAAQRCLLRRQGLVDLDEIDRDAGLRGETLPVVDLAEIAAMVAEALRQELEDVGDGEPPHLEERAHRSPSAMRRR